MLTPSFAVDPLASPTRSSKSTIPPLVKDRANPNLYQNESHPLLPTNPDGSRSVDRSWDMSKTWAGMERVYQSGKAKAIGLANWSVPYLEQLSKSWTVVPAVNQVELHPFLPQHQLKKWCEDKGILLEAYSPLGSTGEVYQISI